MEMTTSPMGCVTALRNGPGTIAPVWEFLASAQWAESVVVAASCKESAYVENAAVCLFSNGWAFFGDVCECDNSQLGVYHQLMREQTHDP